MLRPRTGAPLETVEVKNVCPFFERRARRSHGARSRRARTRSNHTCVLAGSDRASDRASDRGSGGGADAPDGSTPVAQRRFALYPRLLSAAEASTVPHWQLKAPHEGVPAQYVPQVQVEMLVTGARMANYVSVSACQGLHHVRVTRDDEYLTELLHFLRIFWTTIRTHTPPDDDLFWKTTTTAQPNDERCTDQGGEASDARYQRFLARTRELAETSMVFRRIDRPWRRGTSYDARQFFLD